MPRYEYSNLQPQPVAEKSFLAWIEKLDDQFANRDPEHRAIVVRNALHELYLGKTYAGPAADGGLAQQSRIHSFDPRNSTLDPEYYGYVTPHKYPPRKPLIYFCMISNRS